MFVVKERAALRDPAADGVKVTLTEQVATPPVATVALVHESSEVVKSLAPVPVTVTPVMLRSKFPVFLTVNTCVGGVLPTTTFPNAFDDGVLTNVGEGGVG